MIGSNLHDLETTMNCELAKIDIWMKLNKLSLNYNKTTYIVINKNPNLSLEKEMNILINKNKITRSKFVRYLGVLLDENLLWSYHVKYLETQLARFSGILYKIRNFLNFNTIRMMYHSLIYTKLNYGIICWGTCSKTLLNKLKIRNNNILRAMTYHDKYCKIELLHQETNLLKIYDIYTLELAKFMYKLNRNSIPEILNTKFIKISTVHSYSTRSHSCKLYFLPRMNKTIGQKSLLVRGTKLWGELNDQTKLLSWYSFKKALRLKLFKTYF